MKQATVRKIYGLLGDETKRWWKKWAHRKVRRQAEDLYAWARSGEVGGGG